MEASRRSGDEGVPWFIRTLDDRNEHTHENITKDRRTPHLAVTLDAAWQPEQSYCDPKTSEGGVGYQRGERGVVSFSKR